MEVTQHLVELGKKRAIQKGLQNLHFIKGDASSASFSDASRPDIVVALHACGTLSDVAMSLAASNGASFCVCMCCFGKHQDMKIAGKSMSEWLSVPSSSLRSILRAASLTSDTQTSRLAMHTVGALRAEAVRSSWRGKDDTSLLSLQLRAFPSRYSACNLCLVGQLEPPAA
eukprot:TRINITY_DN97441_c0_g1_i1.p1 TRINITY_DN97441_c0_g1~~TRINITY_DN97441_c0_g1_i1.p1  ORF type:complete len:171 (+),score=35.27 TRINITY_DN97441_c0_g1_i1:531-1043(+)